MELPAERLPQKEVDFAGCRQFLLPFHVCRFTIFY